MFKNLKQANYLIYTLFFLLLFTNSFGQKITNPLTGEQQSQLNKYLNEANNFQSEGNNSQAAQYLNKIGFLYWETNNPDLAIEYFDKSIVLNKKIGNKNAIKSLYGNIGMIYSDKGDYETALLNFRKCLIISREQNNKNDIVSNLINISVTLGIISRYDEAINNLEKALTITKESNNIKLLRSCYGMLAENYEKLGNSEKSFEYFNLYASFDKHIKKKEMEKIDKESKQKIAEIEHEKKKVEAEKFQKEVELKKTEESLEISEELNREKQMELELQELTLKEQQAKLKMQKFITYAFIVGFILILVIAYIIYRGYKQKKEANQKLSTAFDKISKQNIDITRSINYAQRIQNALLPPAENLNKFLPESFILFKPRDIVSGDFYWFAKTKKEHSKKLSVTDNFIDDFIITAVDCTGHGVPGAFMSMIGFNLLNEILTKGIIEADEILNELHNGIRSALKQEKTENKDGMDMTLCRIKKSKNILEFSGAKNPLVYIKNGELIRIRGDREGIGGTQKEGKRIFTKHTIEIDQPISFYIFSDGYADQFGGKDGRKFMFKPFRELLVKIHEKPMNEQKDILEKNIKEWMGDEYSQIDDILLIGFKLYPYNKKS
ncbi:MAG: tetratricopeptide repeat protein [Bacteroidales bacterium]|nr:tetratricopeptide repeat protein [Bacteroidales bacterium]